jgi:CubicO group peptidase (beta-lactamase class C family)
MATDYPDDALTLLLLQGIARRMFSAAVMAISTTEGVVWSRSVGNLDPAEPKRPTQLDSLFDLASITKVFVATLFFKLREAGQINLQMPIGWLIPNVPVDKRRITFGQLLNHSSGLPASLDLSKDDFSGDRMFLII